MHLLTRIFILLLFANSLFAQQNSAPLMLDGHQQRQVISAVEPIQKIVFQNLIPGEQYAFTVPDDPSLLDCKPRPGADDADLRDAVYEEMTNTLRFTATQSKHAFVIQYACDWEASNPPRHYISLICQTCKKGELNAYLKSLALLQTEAGYSAEELVKDVLIGGNCFDITGVQYAGAASAIGKFSSGLTNIGFDKGMIMATGDISVAVGPNNSDSQSAGFGSGGNDADLSIISGSSNMFDLAKIEFDFTPTESPLSFEYVFGSEEYCEFVNSQYNDAFGFFVSGPGLNGPFGGAENIAVIPGTNIWVAINNINHLSYTALYQNNTGPGGQLCGQQPSFSPAVNEVQFDGFTRRMIALAQVIPCETYHIQLKIADAGDAAYDSGVFLRDGSFSGGGNASVQFLVNDSPDDPDAFEGCEKVELLFDRVGGNLNAPLAVQFTVSGTATAPADYAPIPVTVVIPSGQDKIKIPINIIADGITEGSETIVVTLKNSCSCLNPDVTLIIEDLPILEAVADSVVICGPGTATVSVNAIQGSAPYTYLWQNGSTDQTTDIFAPVSGNYKVTVTDNCGKTVVRSAYVKVKAPPTATLTPPAPQLCPGGTATINVNFNGEGPFSLVYSHNGNSDEIFGIEDDPYALVITEPGLYTLNSVTDFEGCTGPGQGSLFIVESTLSLSGTTTPVKCFGESNGAINTTVIGGKQLYEYEWTGPQTIGNIPDPTNLPAGVYNVTVTDDFGCTQSDTFTITAPDTIQAAVIGIQEANCSKPNGGGISLTVNGGTPSYTFIWNNSDTSQNLSNVGAGNYSVTVTDNKGCTRTTSATVPGNFNAPTAIADDPDLLTCVVGSVPLDGTGSSSGPGFTTIWTAGPGNITAGANTLNPTVNQAGNYTLTVTDTLNGCTSVFTVTVDEDKALPNADAGADQTFNCLIDSISLNGAGSSQGPNFSYNWTASNGGTILSGGNSITPEIGTPGQFTLVVTNNGNGCTRTDVALVNIDTVAPNAVIANPAKLTCTNTSVTLNGGGSTPGSNVTYLWQTNNGNIQSGQNSSNAMVIEPGLYTLQLTNNTNGCTDVANVTVEQTADVPVASVAAPIVLTCTIQQQTLSGAGSTSGAGIEYSWTAGPGANIVSGGNSLNPVIDAPGTYTLNVLNTANDCASSGTVTVMEDVSPPTIDAGVDQVLSCTTPQTQLTGVVTNGSGTYTYQWAGPGIVSGANSLTPVVNNIGTYTLQVTDTQNGCTSTDAVAITADVNAPVAAIQPSGPITCATTQLTLDATASSTGANFTYAWSGPALAGGQGTLQPVVDQSGQYTLLITNTDNGCIDTMSVTVGLDIAAPAVDAGPDDVLNCYEPQAVLGGAGNPTGAQYTFSWSGPTLVSGANTANPVADQDGTYTLVVTNTQNGCTSTQDVVLTPDFAQPNADAGAGFELTCIVEEYTLTATASTGPNFTYAWSTQNGNFTTPSNILNPTVDGAGVYTLTVTNIANGCTNVSSVTIDQSADVPTALAGPSPLLTCAVTQADLNGNGSTAGPGIQYQWTTLDGNIVSGANTLTPTIDAPGTYVLTVLNAANNCDATSSVKVNEDVAEPVVDAGPAPTLTCTNPSLSLNGSVGQPGSYSYQWQATGGGNIVSGANTLTPVVDAAGTYTLEVTNQSNGCTNTASVVAAVDKQAPSAEIAVPGVLTCSTEQTAIDAGNSSTGNMQYAWTTSGGNIVDQSNPLQPIVDQPGSYTLLITNLDNGCTDSESVQVNEDVKPPVAAATVTGLLTCTVQSLVIDGNGSSQGAQFTYNWSTPNGVFISLTNIQSPTVGGAGSYELTVLNNQNGCSSQVLVNVVIDTVVPVASIATPNLITCTQPQTSIVGSSSQTGANITYQWSTVNGNIVSGQNASTAIVNSTGEYTLLVANAINGCSSTQTVTVADDIVLPNAEAGPAQMLTCTVDEVALAGSGSTGANFTYSWSTVNGLIVSGGNTLSPTVSEPGTYTLLVTNTSTGCTETDDVVVDTETNLPTDFDYMLVRPTCKDNDGLIEFGDVTGGFGPYLFSIDGGNTFSSEIAFNNLSPGTYELAVQDANGCEHTQTIVVPKAPDPGVTITPEISISLGEEVTLKAELPIGYPLALIDTIIWEPMDSLTFKSFSIPDLLRPTAAPVKLTEYTVTVISGDDCIASDRVLIRVDNEPKIYIPNVFTPGGNDGTNDKVTIFAKSDQVLRINVFQIYDRWGERVFEAYNFQPNDPDYGWDGFLNGEVMNPSVFVYYAEIELVDGRVLLFKGDVTLL